jgi:hypothetical protein
MPSEDIPDRNRFEIILKSLSDLSKNISLIGIKP